MSIIDLADADGPYGLLGPWADDEPIPAVRLTSNPTVTEEALSISNWLVWLCGSLTIAVLLLVVGVPR